MVDWLRKNRYALALGLVVGGAAALSLVWVFVVPIYQSPDEPAHLDYALALYEHRGLIRANDISVARRIMDTPRWRDFKFVYYQLHPYTRYLAERTEAHSIAFNPPAKVPPGYGTRAFFHALNHDKPGNTNLAFNAPPSLAYYYPFGYYGLLALWIGLLRCFTANLVTLFFGARILSTMLLVFSLLFINATLRRQGFGRGISLALTLAVGIFPLTSFVCSYIQPDNLSLALVSASFYFGVRAREQPGRLVVLAPLGLALGALAITKLHYYVAVAVPTAGMIAALLLHARARVRGWCASIAVLGLPSLVGLAIYEWTVWGLDFHPLATPATIRSADLPLRLALLLDGFKRAMEDFFVGGAHVSFWGIFGWLDTALSFGNPAFDFIVGFSHQAAACIFLALTLVRMERVGCRLLSIARRGRPRAAFRILCADPLLNSYFLFTVIMLALYVKTNNYFGAQGRNWLPFILPIFLTGIVYAPKALTWRRAQRSLSALAVVLLLGYCMAGSYFAVASLRSRFYAPGWKDRMVEVHLPPEPVHVNQMTWKNGVGEGVGDDPYLVFKLKKPEYVYCVRLRFVLVNPQYKRSIFEAFWLEPGRNQFHAPGSHATYGLCAQNEEQVLTVWINQTVDTLRLDPDMKPCHFEIHEMTAFTKPAGPPRDSDPMIGHIGAAISPQR
jgi:hypothetical protein